MNNDYNAEFGDDSDDEESEDLGDESDSEEW